MGFMKGVAPIRRTTKYLNSSPLVFKPRVKIMTVNFNSAVSFLTIENLKFINGCGIGRILAYFGLTEL